MRPGSEVTCYVSPLAYCLAQRQINPRTIFFRKWPARDRDVFSIAPAGARLYPFVEVEVA